MSNEIRVIALIGAVQFVFVVNFLMLMPLGPDIAAALRFEAEHLGWLSAAYTAASMLAGLMAVRWLDRIPRKSGFLLCFGLFILVTAVTATAESLWQLLAFRAATGLVGSPAVALGMAILIDVIPPQARGRALAKVMIAFSLAAVLGIPLSLELSRLGGWNLPCFAVSVMGAVIWLLASWGLPAASGQPVGRKVSPLSLLRQSAIRKACLIQAGNQFAAFLVVPHFSAFFLLNLGFPREYLGLLYLAGGVVSLLTMQLLGRLTDKAGPTRAVLIASVCTAIGLTPFVGMNWGSGMQWVLLVLPFVLFMAGNSGRNVSIAALTSQVPAPTERAGYMALEGIVRDFSVTLAALVASLILATGSLGELINAQWLGAVAVVLLLLTCVAVLGWHTEVARGN